MPATIDEANSRSYPAVAGVAGIRIDAPHQLGDAPAASQSAPLLEESADALEQLRKQAHQLAEHFRRQQREADLREARMNARQAQLENELRGERLWLLERRAELAEQADDLVRRECELQERASRVTTAEDFLAHSRQQAEQSALQNEEQLRVRHEQLDAVAARTEGQHAALQQAQRRWQLQRRKQRRAIRVSRQKLAARHVTLQEQQRGLLAALAKHRDQLAEREELLAQREMQLAERRQLVELSEANLEREWEELREQQASLAAENRLTQAQHAQLAETAAREREDWQARLADEQRLLTRRGEEVDARRIELEQLQHSLRQLHKEALETRLACEELMGQLSGAAPAAALTSSISHLRRRLDDQFRLAQSDLTRQREELEKLQTVLVEGHDRLNKQKSELQAWVRQREATIEQQAARLVAREQELDSQQEQISVQHSRWDEERRGYQQEIRRLLSRLRGEAEHPTAA